MTASVYAPPPGTTSNNTQFNQQNTAALPLIIANRLTVTQITDYFCVKILSVTAGVRNDRNSTPGEQWLDFFDW